VHECTERDDRRSCQTQDFLRRYSRQRQVERPWRLYAGAEEQATRDCHAVQEDVTQFADPIGNEPLQPLLRRADDQSREKRQQEDGCIRERQPRTIEEESDEAVFEKVESFNRVTLGQLTGIGGRIRGCEHNRGDDAAIA